MGKTTLYRQRVKVLLLVVFMYSVQNLIANDFKILVFHKTNGYRHNAAINASITMLEELGTNSEYDNWTVDNTRDASVFTTENLAQYDVIVFANTSGGGLLNDDQKAAMEAFIQSGKGFVGFHAATDTYRNDADDAVWLWYNELVGAIVQTSPNHSPNNTSGVMNVLTDHVVTDHIDQTWSHDEEWYYWELNGGQLSSDNTNLLEVESTGNNSYDATRPITWLKEYDGGRAFYTALGHNATTYSDNETFREMIQKAVLWVANRLDNTLGNNSYEVSENSFTLYPVPVKETLTVQGISKSKNIHIRDATGKKVFSENLSQESQIQINLSELSSGIYILGTDHGNKTFIKN